MAWRVSENLLVVDLNVSLWPVRGIEWNLFFFVSRSSKKEETEMF